MGANQYLMLFLLLLIVGSASAAHISKNAMEDKGPTGRNLLNAGTRCPINFDQNYKILTGQCEGPDYPKKPCCTAFKQFACPFADQINDLPNGCAEEMFGAMSLHYPVGLFSHMCIEGPEGIECPS